MTKNTTYQGLIYGGLCKVDSKIMIIFGECSEGVKRSLLYLDVIAKQQRRVPTSNPPTTTTLRGRYGLGAFPTAPSS